MIISFDTFGAWATAVKDAKQEQEKNITITENGTGSVLPDSGKTLGKVDYTVDVHPKTMLDEEFTQNGEYNLTGEWKDGVVYVDVAGKPETEKTYYVSQNGIFEHTPDAGETISKVTIDANVHPTETLVQTITENKIAYLTGEWKNAIITVDVPMKQEQAKVDVGALGIKLQGGTFTEVPDYFDLSNCTDMSSMFKECTKLTTIPQLDMSKVTDTTQTFEYCSSLTSLTLVGSLNASLDLKDSPLNEESIKSVLTAASKTTNTDAKTLTFKTGSTFTDDAEGTWAALVADCTTKGWTVNNLTITPAA